MFSKRDTFRKMRSLQTAKPSPTTASRLVIAVGLLVFVLLYALNARGQDAQVNQCTTDEQKEITDAMLDSHKGMLASIEAGDGEKWLEDMRGLRNYLSMADALCRKLSFSSDVDGMQPVIGPVLFPDGLWKATFTTTRYGIVHMTAVEGDCGDTEYLFSESEGEAVTGAGEVFTTSGDCTALIALDNTDTDWTLTFELVRAG